MLGRDGTDDTDPTDETGDTGDTDGGARPAGVASGRLPAMTDVVDARMQHPTPRYSNHQMFDSLRRWTGCRR
jgi:hypothetical protein